MAELGFIGTGHMAAAMVRHLAPKGHQITVTERNAGVAQALASEFPSVRIAGPAEVVAAAETVFLCLRPEVAEDALRGLPFRADQTVISVMAGVSLRTLTGWCAPSERITLMLPMELIQRGGCPIAAWPDVEPIGRLFAPENPVIALDSESDLSACFAATTLVSAIAETLDVGADWLGQRIGPTAAQTFVGELATGMLAIHADDPARFGRLRDSLATPGTLNLAMVQELRRLGLADRLRATLSTLER